jgi:hypothetical protein
MLRRQASWGTAVIAVALAGCAHPQAGSGEAASPASASGDSAPSQEGDAKVVHGDVQKLYEREIGALPQSPFTVGGVSGEVESASPPKTEQDDKSTRLTFSLGTGSPMQCFVYPKPMDVGSQLLAIIKSISSVDVRAARPTDVVVVGEHAAVFAEVQYLAKTSGGAAAGEVKLMAYDHPINPLLCLHDEVGYNAAFKRIAIGLAASLKVEGRSLRIPEFIDLSIEKIEGHAIGYTRSSLMTGDDGKKVYVETSATLVPRSAKDMMVEDESRMETLDKQGQISQLVFAKSEGGEVSEDLTLTRSAPNAYRYDGTHLGKKVSGVVKTKGPKGFPSNVEVRRAERKLLSGDGKSAEMHVEEYHPQLDAGAPVDVLYRLTSKKDRTMSMKLGEAEVTLTFDHDGLSEKGAMPIGSSTLTVERVLVRGTL